MIKCKNCGCRLYDDFGLGLYNYTTGEAVCPAPASKLGDHEKIRVGALAHVEDLSDNYELANKALFKQMVEKQDQFIIEFFGSREAALEQAHLYILEDHGIQYDAKGHELSATSRITLRKKTPEELAASQE